jgi:lipopolysaccharide/colanic/teichoic acid biosynthesis glycosyltransferase
MMKASKRTFDVIASVAGLVVLSPLLLLIAAAIVAEDRGPALFRQIRVGRGARPFPMLKFRTMVVNADKLGPGLTVGADPRITRVGRLLRRTKLDELPQLLNVLRGEMSFVGPRPEVPRYVALYTPAQRRVLALTPGITDPASAEYVDESAILGRAADPERLYVDVLMPRKLALNLAYAERATLGSDIAVILRTLGVIAGPRERAEASAR